MLADQRLCRSVHRRCIERTMNPRTARALQCRAGAAVQYAIAVHAAYSLVAGVKSKRHFSRPLQRNRRRKPGIGAEHPSAGGAQRAGVEMNDLAGGVHPAVGAAGADHGHGLAGDERYGGLHSILDRCRVLLRLPAGELRAIVLYDGGDAADLSFVVQKPPR
jgi:hypothetical protein